MTRRLVVMALSLLVSACTLEDPSEPQQTGAACISEAPEGSALVRNAAGLPSFWSPRPAVSCLALEVAPSTFPRLDIVGPLDRAIETWNVTTQACGAPLCLERVAFGSGEIRVGGVESLAEWVGSLGRQSTEAAFTLLHRDPNTSEILHADILFHLAGHAFYDGTGSALHAVDLESVLVHELGHVLGFAHNHQPGSVMAHAIGLGESQRVPSPADASALCALYACWEGE